ncbi:calcium-binding protein, partial [Scandinavium sp. NPDC088450]|uniref:calcium-binding protein n=1 Tax=Scandinavium sp. NPDC088450 TaxID=3364514 RepID=UPI00385029CF
TYLFRSGHGQDSISDSSSTDLNTLVFEGASSDRLSMVKSGNNLVISAYGSDDSVTLNNYFSNSIYRRFSVVFDDKTITQEELPEFVTDVLAENSAVSLTSVHNMTANVTTEEIHGESVTLWFNQKSDLSDTNNQWETNNKQAGALSPANDQQYDATDTTSQLQQLIGAMASFGSPEIGSDMMTNSQQLTSSDKTWLTIPQ